MLIKNTSQKFKNCDLEINGEKKEGIYLFSGKDWMRNKTKYKILFKDWKVYFLPKTSIEKIIKILEKIIKKEMNAKIKQKKFTL